uniref:Uncharacterized protein n=1 Tax=Phytophthora ramorum TaxID=164328 RepID=H3GTV0_PHYRM
MLTADHRQCAAATRAAAARGAVEAPGSVRAQNPMRLAHCRLLDTNEPAPLVEATTAVLSRDLESSFLFFEDEEAPSKARMAEKNAKAQEAVAEAATENGISARLVVKCHIALVKCVDKLVVVEDFVQGCHHRFIVA